MSKEAETHVWARSRQGGSKLLMLVKIADLADDDGRNCFAEPEHLARKCRMSIRGAQYLLHRLTELGEIDIEDNTDGREIVLRGGRRFRPKWFIHLRCVYAWDAYQHEDTECADFAHSATIFKRGRPRRKLAEVAHSKPAINRKVCVGNSQVPVEQFANHGSAYKEGSVSDPLVREEQGAAPPIARRITPGPDDDDPNFRVILKIAHEALDLEGEQASIADLKDVVKSLCRIRFLNVGPTSELVAKAIDAAVWQRQHRRQEAGA